MVSRTKRGRAFKAVFDDFVDLVRDVPGVKGVVGQEWPGPEIVTFVLEMSDEDGDRISDAMTSVARIHLEVDPEFHVRWLGDLELQDFDLSTSDLVYDRADGN